MRHTPLSASCCQYFGVGERVGTCATKKHLQERRSEKGGKMDKIQSNSRKGIITNTDTEDKETKWEEGQDGMGDDVKWYIYHGGEVDNTDKKQITHLKIPHGDDNITEISNKAFASCTVISHVARFPSSIARLGNYSFARCSSLKDIDLSMSTIQEIGHGAFEGCSSLTTIHFPTCSSLQRIGSHAFRGCYRLADVDIPSSVWKIGTKAFDGCSSLTHIALGNHPIRTIEEMSFANCNGLLTIELPQSCKEIHDRAFDECYVLACIDFPESVQTIGKRAFASCKSLSSIIFPQKTLRRIDSGAFSGCCLLQRVAIPHSVSQVGRNAFEYCQALQDITFPSREEDSNGSSSPAKGLEEIEHGVFSCCLSLRAIELPNTIKKIGEHAFSNCIRLSTVLLPDSIEEIGIAAFRRCKSLKTLQLPGSLKQMGHGVFDCCIALEEIVFPDMVKIIPENTFGRCYSLRKVEFPPVLEEIRNKAFEGCSKLDSVWLPDTVWLIGYQAFKDCQSLETIRLPSLLKVIRHGAFAGGTSQQLKYFYFPKFVVSASSSGLTDNKEPHNNNIKDNNNCNIIPIDDVTKSIEFLCNTNIIGRGFLQQRVEEKAYPRSLWSLILGRLYTSKSLAGGSETYGLPSQRFTLSDDCQHASVIYYFLLHGNIIE